MIQGWHEYLLLTKIKCILCYLYTFYSVDLTTTLLWKIVWENHDIMYLFMVCSRLLVWNIDSGEHIKRISFETALGNWLEQTKIDVYLVNNEIITWKVEERRKKREAIKLNCEEHDSALLLLWFNYCSIIIIISNELFSR